MSQLGLGMCQNMETDVLEGIEDVIFVRGVVRFVMNSCSLGHPTDNPNSQCQVSLDEQQIIPQMTRLM
jgi:hypothetical protein